MNERVLSRDVVIREGDKPPACRAAPHLLIEGTHPQPKDGS